MNPFSPSSDQKSNLPLSSTCHLLLQPQPPLLHHWIANKRGPMRHGISNIYQILYLAHACGDGRKDIVWSYAFDLLNKLVHRFGSVSGVSERAGFPIFIMGMFYVLYMGETVAITVLVLLASSSMHLDGMQCRQGIIVWQFDSSIRDIWRSEEVCRASQATSLLYYVVLACQTHGWVLWSRDTSIDPSQAQHINFLVERGSKSLRLFDSWNPGEKPGWKKKKESPSYVCSGA